MTKVIRVTSHKEVAERLATLRDRMHVVVAEAIARVIEDTIMAESQGEVPRLSGNLANSMQPLDVQITPNGIRFTITYNCDYASYVHEIPPGNKQLRTRLKREIKANAKAGKYAKDDFDQLMEDDVRNAVNATANRTAFHNPPTKWKYLEDPFNRNIGKFPELVLAELERMMEKGEF